MACAMHDMSTVTPTLLTRIVESCESSESLNQIVNYSRDGTAYIQIIGSPKVSYDVVCYVPRSGLANIETAWHEGRLIRIQMSHGTYYGIIIEYQKIVLPQDYFQVTLKLAKQTYSS